MVIVAVVAAVLLVCIGALLGATCTNRVLQSRLHQRARQHAEERRRLAKEWAALRPSKGEGGQQGGGSPHGECPRCSTPLSEWDDQLAPTIVPD